MDSVHVVALNTVNRAIDAVSNDDSFVVVIAMGMATVVLAALMIYGIVLYMRYLR